MLSNIKRVMQELDLEKYWLIKHEIIKNSIDYISDNFKSSLVKTTKIELYFLYDKNILGRITFGQLSYESLKKVVQQYVKNKVFYIKSYSMFKSNKNITAYSESSNHNESSNYTDLIHAEIETIKKREYYNLNAKNLYIKDIINLYYNDQIIEQIYEKNYSQLSFIDEKFNFIVRESIPEAGMYDDMISNSKKNQVLSDYNGIHEEKKYELLKFSRDIFSSICKLFISTLNGYLVLNNSTFMKKDNIGKQILSPNISLIDDPYFYDDHFSYDSEGIELRKKKLIDHGVFNECLNDLVSSQVLGQNPGNAQYNYILNNNIISSSYIIFEFNSSKKQYYNYEAYIFEIVENNIILDSEKGFLSFNCIGVNSKNENKRYKININIIDFFNNIVQIEGKKMDCDSYIVPEVIIKFGGNNAEC